MSTITVKGQVTLPKDLRDAAGLNPGDKVEFILNAAGGIVIGKPGTAGDYKARIMEVAKRRLIRGITTDELMETTRGYSEDAPRVKKRDVG